MERKAEAEAEAGCGFGIVLEEGSVPDEGDLVGTAGVAFFFGYCCCR